MIGFDKYLEQKVGAAASRRYYYNLAKIYGHVLVTKDAREILTIPSGRRKHLMVALTHLAAYNGMKNVFRELKERYYPRYFWLLYAYCVNCMDNGYVQVIYDFG